MAAVARRLGGRVDPNRPLSDSRVRPPDIATLARPTSAVAEAHRSLRLTIERVARSEPVRSLLLVSPDDDRGRSGVVVNLAAAYALAGMRSVAVDADLRRPSLHTLFGVPNDRGLTDMLGDPDSPVFAISTAHERLSIVPSGQPIPSPSDALDSGFAGVRDRLLANADMLVIDCAPVLVAPDAVALAGCVDAVVLVLAAGTTGRAHAAKARTILDRAGARVIGAIVTGVDSEPGPYSAR